MRLFELSVCAGLLCVANCFARAQEPAAARAAPRLDADVFIELKTKAIPAWESIQRSLDSIDVYYYRTYSEHLEDKLVAPTRRPRYRLAWHREKGLALLRAEYAEHPGTMYHGVGNRDYSFEVLARDQQVRGELRSARLAKTDSNAPDGGFRSLRFAERMDDACAACLFIALPLRTLVDSPEFEPVEAVEEREQGARRIRFSARYLGEEGDSRRKGGIYTITVDPAQRYRLIRGAISFPDRADNYTFDLTYHDAPGVFVPKVHHAVMTQPDEKLVTEWLNEFDVPQKFDIPDEEFRLEYYGFDESVLQPLSPRRWLRWLLMACGVASLALGYWMLARRKAKG